MILDNAVLDMRDCEVTACGKMGLYASKGGKLILRGSRFHDLKNNPVVAEHASQVNVIDCEFWEANSAVAVSEGASADVIGSRFHDLRGNGVYVASGAQARVASCTFTRTVYPAVATVDPASVSTIEQCLIQYCGEDWPGLWVDEAAKVRITSTRICDCPGPGILLHRGTLAELHNCDLARCPGGLLAVEGGQASLNDVRLEARDLNSAIKVEGRGPVTVTRCTHRSARLCAVEAAQPATAHSLRLSSGSPRTGARTCATGSQPARARKSGRSTPRRTASSSPAIGSGAATAASCAVTGGPRECCHAAPGPGRPLPSAARRRGAGRPRWR
jgi:hypothetical protein